MPPQQPPFDLDFYFADENEQPLTAQEPEALGGWGNELATGTRALSGFLSGTGFLPGAAIAGAGEALAQQFERPFSRPRLSAIGVEAALGAVPASKLLKAGEVGASALRSGAFAGVGSLGRQLTDEEEGVDLGSALGHSALGAGVGAALGKLFGIRGAKPSTAAPPTPPPDKFIIEPTAQPGGQTLGGGKITRGTRPSQQDRLTGAKLQPTAAIEPIAPRGTPPPPSPIASVLDPEARVPYGPGEVRPSRGASAAAQAEAAAVEKELKEIRHREASFREAQEMLKAEEDARIAAAQFQRATAGARPKTTAATRMQTDIPGGTATVSTRYVRPKKGGARVPVTGDAPPPPGPGREIYDAWVAAGKTHQEALQNVADGVLPPGMSLQDAITGATRRVETPSGPALRETAPVPEVPTVAAAPEPSLVERVMVEEPIALPPQAAPVIPEALPPPPSPLKALLTPKQIQEAGQEGVLTPLFRSRQGAAGYNYRLAQEAEKAGEIASAEPARMARLAEGTIPGPTPKAPPRPVTPVAEIGQQDPVAELRRVLSGEVTPEEMTELSATPTGRTFLQRLAGLRGDESGEISAELAMQLGLGAGGALLGGLTDPFDNPALSMAAGGAAGFAAPSAGRLLKDLPQDRLPSVLQGLNTPDGIKKAAKSLFHELPQIQRFNLLASAEGLPANALVGPYGSALMGALEGRLAGDPRATKALELLQDPRVFLNEWRNSMDAARSFIGRAEGAALGPTSATFAERLKDPTEVIAGPGIAMTAGDLAAKNLLQQAGYSALEAQRMTLTSEPEFAAMKTIAGFGRRGDTASPLMQMLLPFARTTANIVEQGSLRTPGLGMILQSQRANPDPKTLQAVQQLLGLGVFGGSGALGYVVDEDTARWLRRYVSNAAGPYSLLASAGFAGGQAAGSGKPFARTAIREGVNALPLPSGQPLLDFADFILGYRGVPRSLYPAFLRDIDRALPNASPSAPIYPGALDIPFEFTP